MSVLKYNGITVPLILSHDWSMSAVWDDSDTDILYHKYRLKCQGVLSAPLATTYGRPGNEVPQTSMVNIRAALLHPRHTLSFKVNNIELIPALPTALPGTDSRGGPHPRSCVIKQLNEGAFLIDYEIEGDYIEPVFVQGGAAPSGPTDFTTYTGILSHRWRETSTIDELFYTHKTRQGKIVIAGNDNVNLDALRESLVTTSIDPGFRRINSRYTVADDGLSMAYEIEDVETFREPPAPSVKAEGEYIETSPSLGRPFKTIDLRIKLSGCKTSDQGDMIRVAFLIARQRLFNAAKVATLPAQSVLRASIYENEIELRISAKAQPEKARFGLAEAAAIIAVANGRKPGVMAGDLGRFADPPNGSGPGTLPPDPGTRGTANVLLHAAAYSDPFLQTTLDRNTNQLVVTPNGTLVNAPGYIPGG